MHLGRLVFVHDGVQPPLLAEVERVPEHLLGLGEIPFPRAQEAQEVPVLVLLGDVRVLDRLFELEPRPPPRAPRAMGKALTAV